MHEPSGRVARLGGSVTPASTASEGGHRKARGQNLPLCGGHSGAPPPRFQVPKRSGCATLRSNTAARGEPAGLLGDNAGLSFRSPPAEAAQGHPPKAPGASLLGPCPARRFSEADGGGYE